MSRSVVVLLLLAAACAQRPDADEEQAATGAPPAAAQIGNEAGIVLDSATIARIGLETALVSAQTHAAEIELPAVIVEDPSAATIIRSGISGRLALVSGVPWPSLGARLTESSPIAQVGDARPVTVPRNGTVVRVLAQPGELVQAGQPLLELVEYSNPIARIAWEDGTPPASLGFARQQGDRRVQGSLLGPALEADPLTHQPAWLYRIGAGGASLRPGTLLSAFAKGPARPSRSVMVPSSAVVQWDALAWAFVERAPGQFVRVRVPTTTPVPGGWLVDEGVRTGERVVVTGAGLLLSEEFRARIVVGEEVGE